LVGGVVFVPNRGFGQLGLKSVPNRQIGELLGLQEFALSGTILAIFLAREQ